MRSKINELLSDYNPQINYDEIFVKYPWIQNKQMKCILSPDSDGLLCGLLMSYFFSWEIVGYYDGKVLLIKNGISTHDDDVVFLDMEIFRAHVKSVGHHMVLLNKKSTPTSWNNFENCIQLNNLRSYDGKHDFQLKYPFATIHFLIALLSKVIKINMPQSAIAPLFFTDGTFKVLYAYPENVLNWLRFLRIDDPSNPLRNLFKHEHFTVYSQIEAMNIFFRKRDEFNIPGERGDKFVISNKETGLKNVVLEANGLYSIKESTAEKAKNFINLLSETTEWDFNLDKWTFSSFKGYHFTKGDFKGMGWTISSRDFNSFIERNPLSWAMTSGDNIEFTFENPFILP